LIEGRYKIITPVNMSYSVV